MTLGTGAVPQNDTVTGKEDESEENLSPARSPTPGKLMANMISRPPEDRDNYMYTHKHFLRKSQSLDGYVYPALDHQIEATDVSPHNPVCESGHVLSHVVLEDFNNDVEPLCDVCQVPFEQGQHAFTCYQCVASYFLSLPIASETVKAELQMGPAICQKCADRLNVAQRGSASLSL